ncbi:hypothetical protein AEQ67_16850 [Pseudomonas sp. RIT-PI-q]|nr:hypothetical protein AEQ67_16850 [Pseudomonas sp. RIT-PI-q]
MPVDIDVERDGLFAGKPRSYKGLAWGYQVSTAPTVGARLARESGVPVDIDVECDGLFAGKPRSYKGLA